MYYRYILVCIHGLKKYVINVKGMVALFHSICYLFLIHTYIHTKFTRNICWDPSPYLHSCRVQAQWADPSSIRTRAWPTASQRTTICATLYPIRATLHPFWSTLHKCSLSWGGGGGLVFAVKKKIIDIATRNEINTYYSKLNYVVSVSEESGWVEPGEPIVYICSLICIY